MTGASPAGQATAPATTLATTLAPASGAFAASGMDSVVHCDVLVIGAGPAGQKAAIQSVKAGRVTVLL